jgi:hypothetical protein
MAGCHDLSSMGGVTNVIRLRRASPVYRMGHRVGLGGDQLTMTLVLLVLGWLGAGLIVGLIFGSLSMTGDD